LAERSPVFQSLRHRNARLYFVGLVVSNAGTWLQSTALVALVLQDLSDSGTVLGTVVAAQFVPMLLLGAWAGVVADRTNRRRLVFATQAAAAVQALVLGVLDLAGLVTLPLVYLLAAVLGVINALDNPARRSFIGELVEPPELANAMSLNTAVMTGSRVAGPALAGLLIAWIGTGWCFVVNGISFVAVLLALVVMNPAEIHRTPPAARAKGQVREGLRYAWANPMLRLALLLLVVVSTLSFNYQVTIPLIVENVFGGGAVTFGALLSVTSLGSLLGSLITATRREATLSWLFATLAVLGVFMTGMGLSPGLALAFALSVPMGAGGAAFIATTSGILISRSRPDMRGRMLALQSTAFLGSTPIGGPLVGWIAETFGPRWGLSLGGIAALACLAVAIPAAKRLRLPFLAPMTPAGPAVG
jgi:MFS family permease